MRNACLALGMWACMVGCSAADGGGSSGAGAIESTGKASSAIIGGDETTEFPAVVAIAILIPDASAPGGFKQGLCTGTLIAKDAATSSAPSDRVLTAAHCVDPAINGSTETKFLVIAKDSNLMDGIAEENTYAVKRAEYNKDFDGKNVLGGNDVAVLTLDRPVEGIEPLAYARQSLPDSFQGMTLTSVGFGLNDGVKQLGAGIKRKGDALVSGRDEKLLKLGQFFSGDRICQGDSGGPVLATVGGELTVVGVHSFGFIFCVGQGNATNVGTYADFIDAAVTAPL